MICRKSRDHSSRSGIYKRCRRNLKSELTYIFNLSVAALSAELTSLYYDHRANHTSITIYNVRMRVRSHIHGRTSQFGNEWSLTSKATRMPQESICIDLLPSALRESKRKHSSLGQSSCSWTFLEAVWLSSENHDHRLLNSEKKNVWHSFKLCIFNKS